MDDLITIIDDIIKYGLKSEINIKDKETDLEKSLVKIYLKPFDLKYNFDENDYGEFDKLDFLNITKNIQVNFKNFGWCHEVLNCYEILENPRIGTGDAVMIYPILFMIF